MMIGALNFFQGKISRRLAQYMCGKSYHTKKSSDFFKDRLAIKSIWLAASHIGRAQNDDKHGKA
jgi:hypothetical protein